MRHSGRLLRRYAARLFIVAVLIGFYWLAQSPTLSADERGALAAHFRFAATVMPVPSGPPVNRERPVNPSLAHISAWISAVGAAVALADIDGTGLPQDVCYVDTRTNQVIVAPAPGTGDRYNPFALDFSGFRYDATMAPMGCLPGHFTGGPQTDLLVYFWGRTPIVFLRLPGNGMLDAALYRPQEIVAGEERWYSNAATLADVDGDGHPDLIIGNYFPDGARILDDHADNQEAMQHSMSRALNGAGPRLLLWAGATVGANPLVRFRDATDAIPDAARHGWTLAVGAADLDGDQLPELYLANDFGPDRLLYNRSRPGAPDLTLAEGVRNFVMPKSKTLGYDSYKGMGVDFADLGCHGRLDIFVSNITAEYALEESNFVFMHTGDDSAFKRGIAPFIDRSEALGLSRGGWAWDAKLADFDNSGVLQAMQAVGFVRGDVNRWPELQELAMSNDQLLHDPDAWLRVKAGDDLSGHQHNPFFVRSSSGVYYNIAADMDVTGEVPPDPSRGIAIADVFGDGRLDYAVAHQWGPTVFYRNLSPQDNRFLELHLRVPLAPQRGVTDVPAGQIPPSMPAIGAAATLHMPDGQRCLAQVDGGNGHSGKRAPELHFGLGDTPANAKLPVALQWRDSTGRVWHTQITLAPGRHTILLGTPTGGDND
jgi:hypothetical protein